MVIMMSKRPSQDALQLKVDKKQFSIYLELVLLSKTLRRRHMILPDGTERTVDAPLFDPNLFVALPTSYTTIDKGERTEHLGWDAIAKKLSTCAGKSTLKTTKEELYKVVGNAIRRGNYRGKPKGIIVVQICISTDLSERTPLPEIKDPKIRAKAHWTDYRPTEMITEIQYWLKRGGNIGNIPVAPSIRKD